MKQFVLFLLITSLIFTLFTSCENAHATSDCEQTIKFRGVTGYPAPVLWLTQDVDGACVSSYLIQIAVEDSSAHAVYTGLKEYLDWSWLDAGWQHFETQPFIEFTEDDGTWQQEKTPFSLQTPEKDGAWAEAFDKHIIDGGTSGHSWYKEKGINGIVLPKINKEKGKILHYAPIGLYANYDIEQVFYVESSKTLLVITRHEYRAMGLDKMNGFLVLKISAP